MIFEDAKKTLAPLFAGITGGATDGRIARLMDVAHNQNLRIVTCADEKTGCRFGHAACRVGRCKKLGGGGRNRGQRYAYQVWAVWGDAK